MLYEYLVLQSLREESVSGNLAALDSVANALKAFNPEHKLRLKSATHNTIEQLLGGGVSTEIVYR